MDREHQVDREDQVHLDQVFLQVGLWSFLGYQGHQEYQLHLSLLVVRVVLGFREIQVILEILGFLEVREVQQHHGLVVREFLVDLDHLVALVVLEYLFDLDHLGLLYFLVRQEVRVGQKQQFLLILEDLLDLLDLLGLVNLVDLLGLGVPV